MGQALKAIIIGTGFGGLCMGAKLKRAGIDDFIILEKAGAVGGTWRENTYPGAECDIASVLYSYSFYPNPTWEFKWAKQAQILEYINQFTDDMGLREHIHFDRQVTRAALGEDGQEWTVETEGGETYAAQFLINALGQLHYAKTPKVDGQEVFKGVQMHAAIWDHSVDLAGKNIGVMGNAASAIQLIPEIAEVANRVTVYQRSANWVLPKMDRPYSRLEKGLARRIPKLSSVYRGFWFLVGELFLYPVIKGRKVRSWLGRAACKAHIKKHIKDPDVQAALVPTYPIGAKRILLSDKYYPALARDNVELVLKPMARLTETGIEATDNTAREHDIVVYATGFETDQFYLAPDIYGKGETSLAEHWSGGAFAYHGVITHGFPNMFMLYGPNTNTGHTSIIFKLENQVDYIVKLITRADGKSVQVKPQAEEVFNAELQERLEHMTWAKVEKSWYKTAGRQERNWPGSGFEYKRRMKTPIWDDYVFGDEA